MKKKIEKEINTLNVGIKGYVNAWFGNLKSQSESNKKALEDSYKWVSEQAVKVYEMKSNLDKQPPSTNPSTNLLPTEAKEKIIEILKDQVSIRSTKSCVQIADEILELLQPTTEESKDAKEKIHIPSNNYIQKYIELNTRNCDGSHAMDEQTFYEGAKWMRSLFEKQLKPTTEESKVDENFHSALFKEIDKLPYEKHVDDGQYNDGVIYGFEIGAYWAYQWEANSRTQTPPKLGVTPQDTPQDTHQVGMSAEEFFKSYFGHSYNMNLSAVQTIKFSVAFSQHSQKGLFRKVNTSERLPEEDGWYFVKMIDLDQKDISFWNTENETVQEYQKEIWRNTFEYWLEEII